MRSSRTISLFSERAELSRRPTSFVVSIVAHGMGLGVLSFGIIYTPVIRDPIFTPRYTMRHLDLHPPEAEQAQASGGVEYPGPRLKNKASSSGGKMEAQDAVLRQTADAAKGPQTLLQPDLEHVVKLKQETPVPTVAIWSPKKREVKKIISPLPEPKTAADVKPSVNVPNAEVNLADLSITATDLSSTDQSIQPSTTSPLEVRGPEQAQLPPDSTAQSNEEPTPTALLSLSDLRMQEGSISLPPVNETAIQKSEGALLQGQAGDPSRKGAGNPQSVAGGLGAGFSIAGAGELNGNMGADTGTRVWPRPGAARGADGAGTTQQFALPKDGQFGAVVVGASMEERYPEVARLWGDRMAYTVYLHVGLDKSWILQYSLPRTADVEAGGNTARLEAPWPFNIVRPNLERGAINADSLLVHGYVNQDGRFEDLAVAFPPEFSQAQFVLGALEQWQFRPSSQGGQSLRVEVLLIIPEELN